MTPEGLKAVFKDFNCSGDNLVEAAAKRSANTGYSSWFIHFRTAHRSRRHIRSDSRSGAESWADICAVRDADAIRRAQWISSVGKSAWARSAYRRRGADYAVLADSCSEARPKMFMPHPTMSSEEIRHRTQGVWDRFYSLGSIWKRSKCTPTLRRGWRFCSSRSCIGRCMRGPGSRRTAPGEAGPTLVGSLAGDTVQAAFSGQTNARPETSRAR